MFGEQVFGANRCSTNKCSVCDAVGRFCGTFSNRDLGGGSPIHNFEVSLISVRFIQTVFRLSQGMTVAERAPDVVRPLGDAANVATFPLLMWLLVARLLVPEPTPSAC